MWPSGLRHHSSNQKVPSSIPGVAFCIFFHNWPFFHLIDHFFINFQEVLWLCAKKREAKTIKNNFYYVLKNAWSSCWVGSVLQSHWKFHFFYLIDLRFRFKFNIFLLLLWPLKANKILVIYLNNQIKSKPSLDINMTLI